MNLAELQRKLIAAARKNLPAEEMPYAFEKRVMARLAAKPPTDEWAAWARSLWYGAGVCAVIALCMSVWSFTPDSEQDFASIFSQDLEQTIVDSPGDEDMAE